MKIAALITGALLLVAILASAGSVIGGVFGDLNENIEEIVVVPTLPEDPDADAPIDPEILVGMSEEQASAFLTAEGIVYRVVQRDGESYPATKDYNPDRANLTIQSGVVTDVQFG